MPIHEETIDYKLIRSHGMMCRCYVSCRPSHIFIHFLQNMQIMHNATFEPFRCDGLLIVCAL